MASVPASGQREFFCFCPLGCDNCGLSFFYTLQEFGKLSGVCGVSVLALPVANALGGSFCGRGALQIILLHGTALLRGATSLHLELAL